MSTYAYAYAHPDGMTKAERGFRTLTGAVRRLRRSLIVSSTLPTDQCKQLARAAAHNLGDATVEHGITVLIAKEEA